MAFRAAMTGHQVFSTLHANSSLGAVPRLIDMGVRPDIMAGNVIGILAQRLFRKLRDDCKEAYLPSEMECRILGLDPVSNQQMELLKFDSELDELIAKSATVREMTAVAVENNFEALADVAVKRVLEGVTTLDEVSRVVDLTEKLT